MCTLTKRISFSPEDRFTPLNDTLARFLQEENVKGSGLVNVFSPHTTLCIKILENEVLSLKDISNHLDRLAPCDVPYLHDDLLLRQVPREERVNGFAHVRSLYFNHSETIPVEAGSIVLGTWQTVFAVELDPYRNRSLIITYLGE